MATNAAEEGIPAVLASLQEALADLNDTTPDHGDIDTPDLLNSHSRNDSAHTHGESQQKGQTSLYAYGHVESYLQSAGSFASTFTTLLVIAMCIWIALWVLKSHVYALTARCRRHAFCVRFALAISWLVSSGDAAAGCLAACFARCGLCCSCGVRLCATAARTTARTACSCDQNSPGSEPVGCSAILAWVRARLLGVALYLDRFARRQEAAMEGAHDVYGLSDGESGSMAAPSGRRLSDAADGAGDRASAALEMGWIRGMEAGNARGGMHTQIGSGSDPPGSDNTGSNAGTKRTRSRRGSIHGREDLSDLEAGRYMDDAHGTDTSGSMASSDPAELSRSRSHAESALGQLRSVGGPSTQRRPAPVSDPPLVLLDDPVGEGHIGTAGSTAISPSDSGTYRIAGESGTTRALLRPGRVRAPMLLFPKQGAVQLPNGSLLRYHPDSGTSMSAADKGKPKPGTGSTEPSSPTAPASGPVSAECMQAAAQLHQRLRRVVIAASTSLMSGGAYAGQLAGIGSRSPSAGGAGAGAGAGVSGGASTGSSGWRPSRSTAIAYQLDAGTVIPWAGGSGSAGRGRKLAPLAFLKWPASAIEQAMADGGDRGDGGDGEQPYKGLSTGSSATARHADLVEYERIARRSEGDAAGSRDDAKAVDATGGKAAGHAPGGSRAIASPMLASALLEHLPRALQARECTMLYSSDLDGRGLAQMVSRSEGAGPCLVLVECAASGVAVAGSVDAHNNPGARGQDMATDLQKSVVVGCFLPWGITAERYVKGPGCLVFRWPNQEGSVYDSDESIMKGSDGTVYSWTMRGSDAGGSSVAGEVSADRMWLGECSGGCGGGATGVQQQYSGSGFGALLAMDAGMHELTSTGGVSGFGRVSGLLAGGNRAGNRVDGLEQSARVLDVEVWGFA